MASRLPIFLISLSSASTTRMRTPMAVRMSPLLLIMLLVLAVQCFAQPSSSFGEDALPEDDAAYADDGADEEPEESLFDSIGGSSRDGCSARSTRPG